MIGDPSFLIDRPSSLHTWDGKAWVIDPKVAHNAPIDAQIVTIEQRNPISHRWQREVALLDPPLSDGLNTYLASIQAAIRSIGGPLATFTLPPLPDLKLNKGMQDVKAVDDQIAALRAQRMP